MSKKFRFGVMFIPLLMGGAVLCTIPFEGTITYVRAYAHTDSPSPLIDDAFVLVPQGYAKTAPIEPRVASIDSISRQKSVTANAHTSHSDKRVSKPANNPARTTNAHVIEVPFYSQLNDITSPAWKRVGCGIASLAMLIEYYNPGVVSVDALLSEGISAGAYIHDAGWSYAGLISISKKYGLTGETHDLGGTALESAFTQFKTTLSKGPVIASVHYTLDPKNPIPHLIVVNNVTNGVVYYNDPADPHGGNSVSIEQFKRAWKKRFIEIRPLM